jgi:hypothetical protein
MIQFNMLIRILEPRRQPLAPWSPAVHAISRLINDIHHIHHNHRIRKAKREVSTFWGRVGASDLLLSLEPPRLD